MSKQLLDYNPLTGVSTYFEYEASTDTMLITDVQDVNAILDETAMLRNCDEYSRDGIKNDMWHYARLPLTVMLDMKTRFGVDLMAKNPDWKSAFKIINREYPYLKTTTGTHA